MVRLVLKIEFEAFHWNILSSTNLLFLKIVGQYVTVIGRLASTGWHFNSVGSTIPTSGGTNLSSSSKFDLF